MAALEVTVDPSDSTLEKLEVRILRVNETRNFIILSLTVSLRDSQLMQEE